MAEHACLESSPDVLLSTRTTQSVLDRPRLRGADPGQFHIEHHLMASAPYFRLPKLHALLRQRGIVPQPPTYLQLLKRVSMRAHNV